SHSQNRCAKWTCKGIWPAGKNKPNQMPFFYVNAYNGVLVLMSGLRVPAGVCRFGVFEADLRGEELRKNGIRIHLQGQPFHVLSALLTHAGEVVTREELRREVWPEDTFVEFDHALNTAVKKIRCALGDDALAP